MTREIRKIRKLLRRSDYQDALVRYHAARRRGDSADAQRWLKVADMHLRLTDRFDEGLHRSMTRDMARPASRTKTAAPPEMTMADKLDEIVSRMEADIAAGWRDGMPISAPAEDRQPASRRTRQS
ncbi:MAG TPA: hypothetical protein VFV70_05475 [Hyphomonadaceae bacterium]|nr:hypothetical protein [Hyphomonadaceae bacterium]